MTDPQIVRTAALVVSSALRDDDTAARLLLHTMPPNHVMAVCEASLFAMAELVRQSVPDHCIQQAVSAAQELARTEAIQGDPS